MFDRFFIKGTMKSVLGLGITTTIGYGTLFYSFAILSGEIQKEFGWSKSFVFGVFSFGILIGGFVAPLVGRLLDRHGARNIMSIGSLLAFFVLFSLYFVQNKYEYIASMVSLEVVSTLVLYEAAFVAFSQLSGARARVPITQVTLIAGFASTIFWPLIGFLLTFLSWREVYVVLAFFHILIALPIHVLILQKSLVIHCVDTSERSAGQSVELNEKSKTKVFFIISFVFSLVAIPVTVMQTHFVGLLGEFGIEAAVAIGLGALIGPSQVAARVMEMSFVRRHSPVISGVLAISIMAIGLFVLLLSGGNLMYATTFVILYGAGQGVTDIIRGAIPLYLFGKKGYGALIGKITFYRTIVTAFVPFGFAFLLDTIGAQKSVLFLGVVTVFSVSLLVLLYKKLPQWSTVA